MLTLTTALNGSVLHVDRLWIATVSQVMLTTDQLYTSSNVCPRVLWVRQVDDGDSDGDPCPDERWLLASPLTLRVLILPCFSLISAHYEAERSPFSQYIQRSSFSLSLIHI